MTYDRPSVAVGNVPVIAHAEAMTITAEENDRVTGALGTVTEDDWRRPTDCERWDVRAIVVHLIGSADAQASIREFARQMRSAKRLTAEIGGSHWVDGMNERQIRDRAHLVSAELAASWAAASGRALKARRRMPGAIRSLPVLPLGPPIGRKPIGYLFDMGFTRDTWMHRVDISRAVDRPMELTASHDGRIVADIVHEWAALHREPFTLHLTGPAGGTYTSGADGQTVEVDAIEFARILSGRGSGTGILAHSLPL